MALMSISLLTLADEYGALVDFLNQRHQKQVSFSDIVTRSQPEVWSKLTAAEYAAERLEFFVDYRYHRLVKPVAGSQRAISNLRRHMGDNQLVIITDQPRTRKNDINEWLGAHFEGWSPEIHFTKSVGNGESDPESKVALYSELMVGFAVEHCYHTANAICSEVKPHGAVLLEMPWNSFFNPHLAPTFSSWEAIYREVMIRTSE